MLFNTVPENQEPEPFEKGSIIDLKNKGQQLSFNSTSLRIFFKYSSPKAVKGTGGIDFEVSKSKSLYKREKLLPGIKRLQNISSVSNLRVNKQPIPSPKETEIARSRSVPSSSFFNVPYDSIVELHKRNVELNSVKFEENSSKIRSIIKQIPNTRKLKKASKSHQNARRLVTVFKQKNRMRKAQTPQKTAAFEEGERRNKKLLDVFEGVRMQQEINKQLLGTRNWRAGSLLAVGSIDFVKLNASQARNKRRRLITKSQRIHLLQEENRKENHSTSLVSWGHPEYTWYS